MRTQGRWNAAEARAALEAAAPVSLAELCGRGPVLVAAPHPDDESLGCGGLIALAATAGLAVEVAVLTDGAASHPNSRAWPPERRAALRRAELEAAVMALADGRAAIRCFGAPDGGLERVEAEAVGWLLDRGGPPPAAVFASWTADHHPDHKAAARIAQRCAELWGAALYAYPVWGLILPDEADAGPRAPPLRLDISAALPRKRAAVAAHRSQLGEVIDDDPEGFALRPEDVARHTGEAEVFLRLLPSPLMGEGLG